MGAELIADWRSFGQKAAMIFQIILIVLATALIVMPQWFSTYKAERHAARLAELQDGAPEKYFEERRALETYRPRGGRWAYRLFGLVAMAFAITSLVFRR